MVRLTIRLVVVVLAAAAGALALPMGTARAAGVLAGALLGLLAVWLEARAESAPIDRLFWGAVGGWLGLLAGLAAGLVAGALLPAVRSTAFGLTALLGVYVGAAAALSRLPDLEPVSAQLFPAAARRRGLDKILDTSVIIDGRIADICETGFIDGTLVVPRFVLLELQRIADSADGLKRNRGRRGFEVLQRLRRIPKVTVEIIELDFPHVAEVDQKLIELARARGGKVVTNDYNLNKLAELHGVAVLNINEFANALKPVVLPGEPMTVQVLREGKEPGQGVAYLDDGTMVVIDQGRRFIGQPLDVVVTSVLQTPAGRMIFARSRDDAPARTPVARDG